MLITYYLFEINILATVFLSYLFVRVVHTFKRVCQSFINNYF